MCGFMMKLCILRCVFFLNQRARSREQQELELSSCCSLVLALWGAMAGFLSCFNSSKLLGKQKS